MIISDIIVVFILFLGNVRGFLSNFGSRCASQNKSSGPLAALSFPNPAMDLIRMMDDITSSTFNPRVPFESMLHPMLR